MKGKSARLTIRIGDLASRIGVQPEAIRYYERRGLLPRPARSHNGYRQYTTEHVERVKFIKRVQTLGFSLEQIREVLELKYRGDSPCQHVRDLLREKLDEVDRQAGRCACEVRNPQGSCCLGNVLLAVGPLKSELASSVP